MHTTLSYKDFLKHKKNDLWFVGIGGILLIGLIWFFIFSMSFLSTSIEQAFTNQEQQKAPVSFNLNGLGAIGIVRGLPSSTQEVSSTTPFRTP